MAVFDETSNVADLLRNEPVTRNPPPVVGEGGVTAGLILGFGGVGLVKYGVGYRLYKTWPSFREAVDRVDALFRNHSAFQLFHGRSLAQLCGMVAADPVDKTQFGAQLPIEIMQPANIHGPVCTDRSPS